MMPKRKIQEACGKRLSSGRCDERSGSESGDSHLDNLKVPGGTWKVRLIEEDFHRLLFAVEGP